MYEEEFSIIGKNGNIIDKQHFNNISFGFRTVQHKAVLLDSVMPGWTDPNVLQIAVFLSSGVVYVMVTL